MGLFFRSKPERNKTYLDDEGYYRFSDSNKPVHRWVAEKKSGRRLHASEVVHHIDHNKRNNSEENLYICKNQKEHEKIHRLDRIYGRRRGLNKYLLRAEGRIGGYISFRRVIIIGIIVAIIIYLLNRIA